MREILKRLGNVVYYGCLALATILFGGMVSADFTIALGFFCSFAIFGWSARYVLSGNKSWH